MKRRIFVSVALVALAAALGGCTTAPASTVPGEPDRAEIRTRIAAIRTAILAKSAEGIVQYGTADWSFTGPDGATLDRAAYLVRTRALFGRVVAIESLDTAVDRIDFPTPDTAAVEITQHMVRSEQAPDTGAVTRLSLRYRESHAWVRTPDGWRVRSVRFLGAPERTVLPAK